MPDKVLQTWIEAVNQGDLAKVTSMYAPDAVLLPTFSNKRLVRPDQREDYFLKLAGHKDLMVSLRPKTLVIQRMVNDIYALSGIYTWRFEVEEETMLFEARFTFTIDVTRPDPILHHHSSQVPRMV